MSARVLQVSQGEGVLLPKVVSAFNGRIGSDIVVPPYQRLVETEYLPPMTPHWTEECIPADPFGAGEHAAGEFAPEKILQPRRLFLRVF